MWPRTVEIMLGLWLALSPFIFAHEADETAYWVADLGTAVCVVIISSMSCWGRFQKLHLLLIPLSISLMAFAYFWHPHPRPPALQNELCVGLLLLMMSIIPGAATQPPRGWREFLADENSAAGS